MSAAPLTFSFSPLSSSDQVFNGTQWKDLTVQVTIGETGPLARFCRFDLLHC